MHPPTGPVISIVGAGAGGVLAALALLRRPELADASIRLCDARESTGRGVAYGTTDSRHLLNVPVARMSAIQEDPDDFLRWLRHAKSPSTHVSDFVPRAWFGAYLEHSLAAAAASSGGRLFRITDEVVDIRPIGRRHRVVMRGGLSHLADVVVVAVGTPLPDARWLPDDVLTHAGFCSDPWDPGLLSRATRDAERVLILGTGLTMADVAISLDRRGRRIRAVSRRGLLPRSHAERSVRGILAPPVIPTDSLSLEEAVRLVNTQLALSRREFGDWRPGMDSLRPVADQMWGALSPQDQRLFLKALLREWEVRRHRMPPAVAAHLRLMRQEGRLAVQGGGVWSVRPRGRGFDVRLSGGVKARVDAVIDCTGPGSPSQAHQAGNPLIGRLIHSGAARLNVQGLGLDVDPEGRVIDSRGVSTRSLFVLGHYRRGPIWETTAVPQIRAQADALGATVATDLRAAAPARLS